MVSRRVHIHPLHTVGASRTTPPLLNVAVRKVLQHAKWGAMEKNPAEPDQRPEQVFHRKKHPSESSSSQARGSGEMRQGCPEAGCC